MPETGPPLPRGTREALGVDARDTASLHPAEMRSFEHQVGGLSGGYLSPQQFPQSAQYRQRKTIDVGGSTKIHYNLRGAFSISTSIGQSAHASTGQGGRSRVSRSTGGFYQRQTN